MDFSHLTAGAVAGLNDDELADVRYQAAYNAAIIENRNVIDGAARDTARRLRSLSHAAGREQEKRRRQPEPEQPSLDGFIAFAEQSPPDKAYDWVNCDTCLVAAYARSLELNYADVSCMPIPAPEGWMLDEPFTLDYLALMVQPHTYGAAVDLARSLVAAAESGAGREGGGS